MRLLAVLMGVLIPAPVFAQDEWTWVNPVPQGNPLVDVFAIDGDNIIAVGWAGTIVRTTDGGRTWVTDHYGATPVILNGVTFVDDNTGFVVGDEGTIFKTTNAGLTWVQKPSGTDFDLNAVSFGSLTTGVAVGAGGPSNTAGMIIFTSDAGETWSRAPMGSYLALYDVSFASSMVVTAVGRSKVIMRTTNGGATWAVQSSTPIPTGYSAVTFADGLHGTIGGAAGEILHTTDGGLTWVPQMSGFSGDIFDLDFVDSLYGMASSYATLLRTTNGGLSWATILPDTVRPSGTMFMISRDSVVFAGGYGFVGGSIDGGYTWSSLQWSAFTVETLEGIAAFNPSVRIVSEIFGGIHRTTDGGMSWILVYEGEDEFLIKTEVVDSNTAYALGEYGLVIRTTDQGLSWITQRDEVDPFLLDMDFVDASTGTAVGQGGAILRTTDGGESWETQTSSTNVILWGISLVDSFVGYAVGESGTILKTTNAGISWTSLVSGTAQILVDVYFSDDSRGTVVGTGGTILNTTDGGTTWTSQVFAGEYFSRVEFLDRNIGLVVGDFSILRTTDSGLTWVNEYPPVWINVVRGVALNIGGYDYIVGSAGLMMKKFREDYGTLAPVVSDIPSQSIDLGGRFTPIRVDNYVSDPDDPDSLITWTWSGNTNLRVTWNPTRRRIIVRPPIGWSGSETITFTATDPDGLTDSDAATYKVAATDGAMLLSQAEEADEHAELVPEEMFLAQNYPNPFNPSTSISFAIPVGTRHAVSLQIFDVLGRQVATLVEGIQEPGYKNVEWDASDMPSGVYYCRLSTPGFDQTRKLVLLR